LSFNTSVNQFSLSTRVIDPATATNILPAPVRESNPVIEPSSPALPIAKPSEVLRSEVNPNSEKSQKQVDLSQLSPLKEAVANTAENIALIQPSVDSQMTQPAAAAAPSAPATHSLKLSYPASTRLQFDGTNVKNGSTKSGSSLLYWSTDGTNYKLSLEATALVVFSLTEKSAGRLSINGLAPDRFSSTRTGRSEQATHFMYDLGQIKFSSNRPDVALQAGAQDRLSAMIQLAGMIGGDPERYKSVDRIYMQVAGLGNADIWEFNLQGMSELSVPAGKIQALKLMRTPRSEFDQRLEIWLAPQLGYLPVRIRQSAITAPDQDFNDLVLNKLP
jgi:Protein of unknown function (DUF3108)